MIILVTGASGFAGSHLLEALLADPKYKDAEIHGTCYGHAGFIETLIPKENIHAIDLTDQEATEKLVQAIKPDWIFHLAAFAAVGKSYDDIPKVLQNNLLVQTSMLEAVRKHAPKARVLVIGSAEEYGWSEPGELPIDENHPLRPVNAYGVSKVAQDLLGYAYFKSFGLDIVRVRPFNHIGPRQSKDFVVPAFAEQIARVERGEQDAIRVGNLDAIRDFSDVNDIVRGYILLMEKGVAGEVYNLGSGKGVRIKDLLDDMIAKAGVPIPIVQDPARMRPADIPEMVCDNGKARKLGWEVKSK